MKLERLCHMSNAAGANASFTRKAASFAQRIVYSREELVVSLSNTLKMHDYTVQQERTLLGRFLSLFTKSTDPETLVVDGMRLTQLFEFAGMVGTPGEVSITETYKIDRRSLQRLLTAIGKESD